MKCTASFANNDVLVELFLIKEEYILSIKHSNKKQPKYKSFKDDQAKGMEAWKKIVAEFKN